MLMIASVPNTSRRLISLLPLLLVVVQMLCGASPVLRALLLLLSMGYLWTTCCRAASSAVQR
jgi:hypothetical protein